MTMRNFRTVADELLPCANALAEHHRGHGYSVVIEKRELEYPFPPTMRCRRKHTTILIEVSLGISIDRLLLWVAFCKSSGSDTRIALGVPTGIRSTGTAGDRIIQLSDADLERLRTEGIGLFRVGANSVTEEIAARDVGVSIALPPLPNYSRHVREALGPAYEKFERGMWRESYEDACKALEIAARRHLKHWSKTGRILVVRRSGPITLQPSEINRMTMGQLAQSFEAIQTPNQADTVAYQALRAINKDRNAIIHHTDNLRTEARLRKNVGRHMWTIVSALERLL